MDLVNKQVTHESFGKGNVVKCSDSYIKIDFPSGNKTFVFPDAFVNHLAFINPKAADSVERLILEREKERKKEELELQKQKELKLKQQKIIEQQEAIKSGRVNPRMQSVFWCEDEELENIFTEWMIFTDTIKSGQNKGQPRRLAQMNYKSACLITTRDKNMEEEDRRIVGMFMAAENFDGSLCDDGYIPGHKDYRIQLTEEESRKILFWKYYINKNNPHRMTWNSGRHRYFDNIWMAQILKDIIDIREDPQERQDVQSFFSHFCQIHCIEKDQLLEPNGPLINKK